MAEIHHNPEIRSMLIQLGYNEAIIQDIQNGLNTLFRETGFPEIKRSIFSASQKKDITRLVDSLKKLMVSLEDKGFFRPGIPQPLLKLLVNGLNLKNEDIFAILDRSGILDEIKRNEKEFLVSCAALTQLGYILVQNMIQGVKTVSAGCHVCIMINGFSPGSMMFIDFSLDSIKEINVRQAYDCQDNFYFLKDLDEIPGMDKETFDFITEYYSFFQVTTDIGLSHIIHNNLGIAYDTAGMYREAFTEFREALKLDTDYLEAHNNLAVIYNRMGRNEEAIGELREVLGLYPGYTEGHSNLAHVYTGMGRYDEAISEFEKALVLDPDYVPAHNSLGHIFAGQKKYQEAVKEFQEAIRLDPKYVLARNNLGHVYLELEKYADAIKEFGHVTTLDPGFIEGHQGMGLACYSKGRYDKAAHAWARAVYLKPELMDSVPDELKLKVNMTVSRLRFSK
ncbi:MAG: tetratricopeptide repeat protein [Methanosarcinales archaeon]|nr:tetratricopeptide repeat protein [Methanosarcinales archaeon]